MVEASIYFLFLLHIMCVSGCVCVCMCCVVCANHIMHSHLGNWQSEFFNPLVISNCQ